MAADTKTMRETPSVAPAEPRDAGDRSTVVGGAHDAMHAVTRLLGVAAGPQGPDAMRERLVVEARELFGATRAVLLSVAAREGRVEALAASPAGRLPRESIAVDRFPVLREVLDRRAGCVAVEGEEAASLDRTLSAPSSAAAALLVPMRSADAVGHVLFLAYSPPRRFSPEEIEVAGAFAAAASAGLAQMRLAEERSAQIARQAALARAAKSLNDSLDLNRVLVRICFEAAAILAGEVAVVYRGTHEEGLSVEATHGMPPEAIGYRMQPGTGLAGKVAELDRPLLTNDYQGMPGKADGVLFGEVRSCVAVPIHWDGRLRGVLAVGFTGPHLATAEELNLLEAFGELAGAACRNATAHAGLAHAARTDGLTGCLNHAAMHDTLRREIERCERTGHRLSLVLVDMDDFKQVNEQNGHLVGDEVLRRVGHALRQAVRPYDLVARYGGDEFAIVTIEADEPEAIEVATRALEGVADSLEDLDRPGAASAGVAEWTPGETPTGLIDDADRALMFGKQEGGRGVVTAVSSLPEAFRSGRPAREHSTPASAPSTPVAGWPDGGRAQTERLRKRTRQLALANALGTRLAAMTEPQAIMDAAVDELHRAFGYFLCAVIRLREDGSVHFAAGRGEAFVRLAESEWSQPRDAGLIGRCLRERRPVIEGEVPEQEDYLATAETGDVRSELVVPLWVGDTLWGAIDVEEVRPHAFDEDDARLVQTVADQVGSALRSAMLYKRLDSAYVGTAEALAAALEAKDSYSASHSRAVVERTAVVGRRLGLSSEELRVLRLGAIFHDIGKIAVPEAILNKRGPLTDAEREEIKRHPIVGERILSSVDFLEPVLPLVRHEHERWDGCGYPDGLAGEKIPLGSRIILACDAYDAMLSDRPYRSAMTARQARAELLAGAGTQFDERVVSVLLQLLEADSGEPQPGVSPAR